MKILFVDDEELIRKGLQVLIPWEEYGFTEYLEAEDGETALALVEKENPQLVLMDIRMDHMDGITVSKMARQKGYQGRVIIISGYSDFSYAKEAIDQGVTAYLLKPVDPDELIAAVEKAVSELEKEKLVNVVWGQPTGQAKQLILTDMLAGRVTYNKEIEETFQLQLKSGFLRLSAIFSEESAWNMDEITDKIWPKEKRKNEFMIMIDKVTYVLHSDARQSYLFDQKMKEMQKETPVKVFIITGNPFYDAIKLNAEKRKLDEIIDSIFYYANEGRVIPVPTREKEIQNYDLVAEIQKLINDIISNDTVSVEVCLDRFSEYLFFRKNSKQVLAAVLGNIYQQLRDKLCYEQPKLEHSMISQSAFMNDLCQLEYFYEYMRFFEKQIWKGIEVLEEIWKEQPGVRICRYIEENYASGLKLEDIAVKLGYNSVYLGRLFRNETGMSFNAYLDHVRIEKAKELLKQQVSVARTAEQAGYKDIDYFTKKFKKYMGCLPSEYQKREDIK